MTFLARLSQTELNSFLNVVQESLSLKSHKELLLWLNKDVQQFVPHDILLTAWGDFSLELIYLNVIAESPGPRTGEVDKHAILPFLTECFERWVESNRSPLLLKLSEGNCNLKTHKNDTDSAIPAMHYALVHGIKDERGRHDCLYIAMSNSKLFEERSAQAFQFLLPYIDTALRQVAHIPAQYPDSAENKAEHKLAQGTDGDPVMQENALGNLSQREANIMHWVCMGKTNAEIGQILDISFFTVKNHLQRIFRKINVQNRAQAVAKLERQLRNANYAQTPNTKDE
jgi:transcriptional regulator EpsA